MFETLTRSGPEL